MDTLAGIRDPHAVEALVAALKLRMPAAEKLWELKMERDRPRPGRDAAVLPWQREVSLALDKSEEPVAKHIGRNLLGIRETYAVTPLLDALKDEEPFIRMMGAVALANFRDSRIAPRLIPLLSDNSSMVRGKAAVALGQINDSVALDPLILALGEENPMAQSEIAGAIAKVGGPEAVPRLEEMLKDPRPRIQAGASMALKLIRSGPAKSPAVQ